ncbi:mitochondrial cardiolipin hydrolase-like [Drosophila montana]|uniref:mitochondrial cardiolipin hydrolase-like n=1 Tax=Drosophila montana TaxID=40370 RepID=UPI00313D8FAB
MLPWIRNHPIWSTLIIGAGTIAASEVLWYFYNYVRDRLNWRLAQVHEVLMFNELGFECFLEHRAHSRKGKFFICANTHCTQRHIERVAEQLARAKYSIDLAMYSLSSPEILLALGRALQRNVAIRLIVSQPVGTSINLAIFNLMRGGLRVRSQPFVGFMHHKFCVIDGRTRVDHIWGRKRRSYGPPPTYSVLINGSVNWTQGGFGANWENLVITSNHLLASEFQAEFDRMWKAFKGTD